MEEHYTVTKNIMVMVLSDVKTEKTEKSAHRSTRRFIVK